MSEPLKERLAALAAKRETENLEAIAAQEESAREQLADANRRESIAQAWARSKSVLASYLLSIEQDLKRADLPIFSEDKEPIYGKGEVVRHILRFSGFAKGVDANVAATFTCRIDGAISVLIQAAPNGTVLKTFHFQVGALTEGEAEMIVTALIDGGLKG